MSKLSQSSGRTSVLIERMSLYIQEVGVSCESTSGFFVDVVYNYEPAIKATEDEEGCSEYVEITQTRLCGPVKFDSDCGMSITLSPQVDFLNILTDSQYEELIQILLKQISKNKPTTSFRDPDNYRDKPNERIRQELGWGLVQSDMYERY